MVSEMPLVVIDYVVKNHLIGVDALKSQQKRALKRRLLVLKKAFSLSVEQRLLIGLQNYQLYLLKKNLSGKNEQNRT